MTAPVRLQRKRTLGWRMPPNAIYVGRGTRWGNPFRVGNVGCDGSHSDPMFCEYYGVATRAEAVEKYRAWREAVAAEHQKRASGFVDQWLHPLRGKDLACWCPLDQPCHADVLLELANK